MINISKINRLIRDCNWSALWSVGLRRDTAWSLVIHGTYLPLTLLVGVFLARGLGPTEYGAWATSFALLALLMPVAVLGLPNVVTRRVATHFALGEAAHAAASISVAIRLSVLASVLIIIAAVVFVGTWGWFPIDRLTLLYAALASLPFIAATHVLCGALRGFGKGNFAQFAMNIVRPLVILGVTTTALLNTKWHLHAVDAMVANLAAAVASFAVSWWLIRRTTPNVREKNRPALKTSGMWREAMPFLLIGLMSIGGSRVDLLLISGLLDIRAAGLYEVATKGAELVLVPLTATTVVLAPEFARRRALGDDIGLQRLATYYGRGLFLVSLPIAFGLVFFGHELIGLLFGREYVEATGPLTILSLGYIASLSLGPANIVLGMTGHSSRSAIGALIAVALGVALSLALIPTMGLKGAALSRGISQTIGTAWLAWQALKRILLTTPIFLSSFSLAAVKTESL